MDAVAQRREGVILSNEITYVRDQYAERTWECGRAAAEAMNWLAARNLICNEPGGHNAYNIILTRSGIAAAQVSDFAAWVADREIPEALLHPTVVVESLPSFRLGRFDTAVFEAFKTLEIEIREAAGLSAGDVGVPMVRKAFHPNDGPLTDMSKDGGEREALAALMAGAIGSYKNPTSHRRQALGAAEAREMLIIASHLLRIVDSRRSQRGS